MIKKTEDIFGKTEDKYSEDYYFRILNKNRHILLYSDIDPCSAETVVAKIKSMNHLNSTQTITLEINSPGGDVSAGISIINTIEQSKAPIITIINGEACSMAALIAIVGKKRYMYSNSFIMFHPISEGQSDYLQFIKDRTNFLIGLEKNMEKLCTKYTKLNTADIAKMNSGELWLNAENALAKGVINEIIQ